MGILSAMNKSVGGLNAQSFALENISGNIANAQTTAFKRTDTSFQDLVQSGNSKVSNMTAGNVRATARSTANVAGAIEGSSTETFMGVKGDGYFVVRQKTGEIDSQTVFSTASYYTRRGDFTLDRQGYLVNGSNYFLAGLPIDPETNNPVGDTPGTIQINNNPVPAEATTEIQYRLNLPTTPVTTYSKAQATAGSDIWAATGGRVGPPAGGVVLGANATEFIENSISGNALTVYDATGNPIDIQLRWAKTAANTWEVYYLNDPNAGAAAAAWTRIARDSSVPDNNFNFTDGKVTEAVNNITLPALTINGTSLSGLTLSFGTAGITQYADTSGSANVRQLTQDGLPAGNFQDVKITDGGRVVASYSNGKQVDLYQIPLVTFTGKSALRPLDGGAYAETKESGPPSTNVAGTVVGSALEASNVDIGEEFTKLIVTQQAFSANSKVITTADQMMNDVLNIIR